MNKKSGSIIRIVLGGYLVYLGIRILVQVTQEKPSDMMLMSVLAVVFVIVGGAYALHALKRIIELSKAERQGTETEEAHTFDESERTEHAVSVAAKEQAGQRSLSERAMAVVGPEESAGEEVQPEEKGSESREDSDRKAETPGAEEDTEEISEEISAQRKAEELEKDFEEK